MIIIKEKNGNVYLIVCVVKGHLASLKPPLIFPLLPVLFYFVSTLPCDAIDLQINSFTPFIPLSFGGRGEISRKREIIYLKIYIFPFLTFKSSL
jgi:hypothetical protein